MLKRLWQILGPVATALLLIVLLILFFPESSSKNHPFLAEKKDAVSLNPPTFKNRSKKVRAFSDEKHRFVPFFGSSELKRFDIAHPSVLAEAYDRTYRPYLLGEMGATSLTQYFGMQQFSPQLKNKQAVFIVSPQWFIKGGQNPIAFKTYYSLDQLISFLRNQEGTESDRFAAKRLLDMDAKIFLSSMVRKVAEGKKLSRWDLAYLDILDKGNRKGENVFGSIGFESNYQKKVQKLARKLPADFSYETISQQVEKTARKQTSGNMFEISKSFYNKKIKNRLKKLKGSQATFNYLISPEYNDLQLVLSQFARSNVNVLFVIPPVNEKWRDYTGLNKEMYEKTVDKIRYQLVSQGFTNIADFSKDGTKPYFMTDTIHLGWKGWLELDQYVNPFLSQPQKTPPYRLDGRFLTKQWAEDTSINIEDAQ